MGIDLNVRLGAQSHEICFNIQFIYKNDENQVKNENTIF
jgi:hypothetical protein